MELFPFGAFPFDSDILYAISSRGATFPRKLAPCSLQGRILYTRSLEAHVEELTKHAHRSQISCSR